MAEMLGHTHNHRSGRPGIHSADTVVMSEQRYNAIERHAVDCWVFVAFFVAMAIFAHI